MTGQFDPIIQIRTLDRIQRINTVQEDRDEVCDSLEVDLVCNVRRREAHVPGRECLVRILGPLEFTTRSWKARCWICGRVWQGPLHR